MNRVIDDEDYINFLPTELHRRRYFRWKAEMIESVEFIVSELERISVEELMRKYNYTPKDIALLVRLNFVTDEEAERFDLKKIERSVPS